MRKGFDPLDIFDGSFDFIRQITDTAHTGIDGDETGNGFSHLFCRVADRFCVGGIADYRRNIVFCDDIGVEIRRQAQHDDILFGSGFTQGDRFLQSSDGKRFSHRFRGEPWRT